MCLRVTEGRGCSPSTVFVRTHGGGEVNWFLITRILIEFWDRAWYEEGCGGRKHKLFEEQGGN